jgi:hypothetical protein
MEISTHDLEEIRFRLDQMAENVELEMKCTGATILYLEMNTSEQNTDDSLHLQGLSGTTKIRYDIRSECCGLLDTKQRC